MRYDVTSHAANIGSESSLVSERSGKGCAIKLLSGVGGAIKLFTPGYEFSCLIH